jgi:predicted amidophosphoribosyltransferase
MFRSVFSASLLLARSFFAAAVDLVLPLECAGCGAKGSHVCSDCRLSMARPAHRTIPDPPPPGLPETWTSGPYECSARSVILAHKEDGRLSLAEPLGAAVASATIALLASLSVKKQQIFLVPVPSARRATRQRGHDPTRRMALAAARQLRRQGTDARVVSALAQRGTVADQSGLSATGRQANLAGALFVRTGAAGVLRGRVVVLVDDVITTGASLAESDRALRSIDVVPAGAVTVAATQRVRSSRWAATARNSAL